MKGLYQTAIKQRDHCMHLKGGKNELVAWMADNVLLIKA